MSKFEQSFTSEQLDADLDDLRNRLFDVANHCGIGENGYQRNGGAAVNLHEICNLILRIRRALSNPTYAKMEDLRYTASYLTQLPVELFRGIESVNDTGL